MQNNSETNIKEKVEFLAQYIENDQDLGKAIRKLLATEKPTQATPLPKIKEKPTKTEKVIGIPSTKNEQEFVIPKKTEYTYKDVDKCKELLYQTLSHHTIEELKSAIGCLKTDLNKIYGWENKTKSIKGFAKQKKIVKATILFLKENVFDQQDERGYEKANKYTGALREYQDHPFVSREIHSYVVFTEYEKVYEEDNMKHYGVVGNPNKQLSLSDFIQKLLEEKYVNRNQHEELLRHPYSLTKTKVRYNKTGRIEYKRKAVASFKIAPNGIEWTALRSLEWVIRRKSNH